MAKKNQPKSSGRQKEVKEFDEVIIEIRRVTRVVKGGRRLRFSCLVAIGDRKGRVGIGLGKATEVVNGIKKAVAKAKTSLIEVPINENGTIPHQVDIKHKAAKFFIMPAAPGTGVIAGGSLRKILNLAGVKNVLSKSHGTNNKIANAQAAIKALTKLRPIKNESKNVSGPSNEKKEEKAQKSEVKKEIRKKENVKQEDKK